MIALSPRARATNRPGGQAIAAATPPARPRSSQRQARYRRGLTSASACSAAWIGRSASDLGDGCLSGKGAVSSADSRWALSVWCLPRRRVVASGWMGLSPESIASPALSSQLRSSPITGRRDGVQNLGAADGEPVVGAPVGDLHLGVRGRGSFATTAPPCWAACRPSPPIVLALHGPEASR